MNNKIEISHRTLVVTAALIFIVWMITKIWEVVLIVFVAFIIMSALKPAVELLEHYRIPRGLSIILVYILLWLGLGGLLAAIIPPLVVQTKHLLQTLPVSLDNIQYLSSHQQEITNQLLSLVGSLPENVFKIASEIFGNIINLVTTMVISFYLLSERENFNKYLTQWLGSKHSVKISRLISDIESRLGGWVRGEMILMFTIGFFIYIGLRILGVESALPLAILGGMLEIIPSIGPIISAIPAVIIALTIHPLVALSTVALYFLVHNLENSLVVPMVMHKATGVHPLISLLGLMIGFELAGATGTVLAIPTLLVLQTIGFQFFSLSHLEDISDTD